MGYTSYNLCFCSQIISQAFNFIKKEVHIFLGNQWRKNNHAEKVDLVSQRLVPHHHSASFHHALLDDWSYLLRKKREKRNKCSIQRCCTWVVNTWRRWPPCFLTKHTNCKWLRGWISVLNVSVQQKGRIKNLHHGDFSLYVPSPLTENRNSLLPVCPGNLHFLRSPSCWVV